MSRDTFYIFNWLKYLWNVLNTDFRFFTLVGHVKYLLAFKLTNGPSNGHDHGHMTFYILGNNIMKMVQIGDLVTVED